MSEINATIKKPCLLIEDHNILTAMLMLDYGDSTVQGFGGFALCPPREARHYPDNANYAGLFIRRSLEIAGVRDWDDLQGRPVRVKIDGGKIVAIGHIINNDWFDPHEDFDKLERGELPKK